MFSYSSCPKPRLRSGRVVFHCSQDPSLTHTHSPDCIATLSIGLGWQGDALGARETMAYLSQADIANLSSIRRSLISAHGTAVSLQLPHGQIRHTLLTYERGHEFKFVVVMKTTTSRWQSMKCTPKRTLQY